MDAATLKAAQDILTPLFTKLGELGAAGFELAIRQNYVYVAEDALVVIIATIIFLIILASIRKALQAEVDDVVWVSENGKEYKESYGHENEKLTKKTTYYEGIADFIARDGSDVAGMIALITGALSVIYLCVVIPCLFGIVERCINPQFQALMDIIHLVGGKS
jgi:hypothetical protein